MFNYWLENVSEKEELIAMTPKDREESFYKDLEFGTGGMRGIMGMGTNRINKYTVRRATQGLANEIISHGNDFSNMGVVIAYDSRNNSYEYAIETAKVLCGNNIKTYLFDSLRPTPELSFAVRHLGCARGVVITASHNPKQYNGYKIYGEDGGQLTPSVTNVIIKFINDTDYFKDVKVGENHAEIIGETIDTAYINAVFAQKMNIKIPKNLKVVYTPLHGAGNISVRRILKKIGLTNLIVVKEQELPNGNFPTVDVPNPENKYVFDLAISLAEKESADVIIGTDPDSDRIGVVVKDNSGKYIVLNGNQTGALLCDFILRNTDPIPSNPNIVKTIVTTDIIHKIANDYSVDVENVLTGFKFIGEKIKEYELNGKDFLFGLEESYGYLKGTYCRDKDAVVAAMLIIQMVAQYKFNGLTLYDGLINLYEKYGYYCQELISTTFEGIDGNERISAIMKKLRNNPPINAKKILDFSFGVDGLPKSDVIKFEMDNGWIVARPSGTEPKIKIYIEISSHSEEDAKKNIKTIKNLLNQLILQRK